MSDNTPDGADTTSEEIKHKLSEKVRRQQEQMESLREQISHLRENAVHTVAVEQALADSGLPDERIPEIMRTIEQTDSELWSDDFDWETD